LHPHPRRHRRPVRHPTSTLAKICSSPMGVQRFASREGNPSSSRIGFATWVSFYGLTSSSRILGDYRRFDSSGTDWEHRGNARKHRGIVWQYDRPIHVPRATCCSTILLTWVPLVREDVICTDCSGAFSCAPYVPVGSSRLSRPPVVAEDSARRGLVIKLTCRESNST